MVNKYSMQDKNYNQFYREWFDNQIDISDLPDEIRSELFDYFHNLFNAARNAKIKNLGCSLSMMINRQLCGINDELKSAVIRNTLTRL